MDSLMAKNRFHALCEEDDEGSCSAPQMPSRAAVAPHDEGSRSAPQMPSRPVPEKETQRTWKVKQPVETGITTSASLREYPWITKVSQGTRKKWKRRMAVMPSIGEEAELNDVDTGCG